MKKSGNLFVVLGMIAALIVGFLIGISVDFPKVNNQSLSGTIGKVNNYRNTQVSEADIQLKNELVTDTAKLKMLRGYFNFYYVGALKMSFDADMAVKEAVSVGAFQNANKTLIASMESYGKYLLSARTDLMLALAACSAVGDADPIQLRNALNQAKNVVAQINYRDRVVLDFVKALSDFIMLDKAGQYKGLEQAHDLLVANAIFTAAITKNKVVLKYLDKTTFFTKSRENLKGIDQQKLSTMIQQDMEKLSYWSAAGDAEKLKLTDAEKLKSTDAEKLGGKDSEQLGIYYDASKLGSIAADAEKLGSARTFDMEKLATYDAENLKLVFDAEKLGTGMSDDEKMGSGGFNMDSETLGFDPNMTGKVFNPNSGPIRP
jgi:hypothetical protein